MRGAAQPANRGGRSQRSKVTLWDRPSPRMAASAVCESSRRRTLTYVKPKSRNNPCTYGANAGAVSRCCHSPLWGSHTLAGDGPTRVLCSYDHEDYRLLPRRVRCGQWPPCSCWRVVGLQLRRCVARPLAPRPTFRSYGDVRLRPQISFQRTALRGQRTLS